jgi:acetylornithine deacetylase/succinyl-diaminopimelate desuccinylase family protein
MIKIVKILRDLIALPSVNPDFVPTGDPRAGEKRVADYLAAFAAQAGLDVEFQRISSDRANLLVTYRPAGKCRRRIILAPHMDTVPDAHPKQLTPVIKQGRLYGRGACDTKGSVAAMLYALCEIARSRKRPAKTAITLAALVDEECGQTGSRAFAASGLKADLAIVGEPTRLKVVTAHKGDLWLKLSAQGRAAHGASPELGRNAVHMMARAVDVLETEYAAQLRERNHWLLGHPTINVGMIRGGTQANIVPDYCSIVVDRRTIPGETDAAVRREIVALLKQRGIKVTLANNKAAVCLPLETDPKLPLVQQLLKTARQKRPEGVCYFCDASVLSCGGMPSVVFGPGDIAQAHTADEWIGLRDLEKGAFMLQDFLSRCD